MPRSASNPTARRISVLVRRAAHRLRRRIRRASAAPPGPRPANLLVISDLHLGEDLKPVRNIAFLRRLVTLERKLGAFLEHYATHRRGDRPWRLVINGDMVDFMHVHLVPEDWCDDPDLGRRDERRFGIGTGPRAVDRKLERILERHPGVFERLARFVEADNELVVVIGNHDVEFHWPQVQEQFRARLAELVDPAARERVYQGITFYPWFYCEQGLVYVEHGHQYDASSSWDSFLDPRTGHSDEELELNLSAASVRYFINLNPHMDPHGKTDWGIRRFVGWSLNQGFGRSLRIFYHYAFLSWRLISLWRQYGHEGRVKRRAAHLRRLYEIAEGFGLSADVVLQLDALRRRPATASILEVLRALCLDRVLLLGGAAGLAALALLVLPFVWGAPLAAAVLAAALLGARLIGGGRDLDPARWLPVTAQKIRESVGVPLVVFGHTHDAQQVPLEDGGWYFNTGTWIDGREAGDGVPFTHLIIEHQDDRVHAQLYRWEGESVPLAEIPGAVLARDDQTRRAAVDDRARIA